MTSTTHHSPRTALPGEPRLRRTEAALVLGITLAGLLVRVVFPSHAAVEHFDEGVYATRLWFAEGDDAPYPDRHLYAPPLVPWLARWSIDLFGPGLWGAMLPGIVFGTLTIALVWWTARRWFGPAAGLAGAILAAGSDFHVLYSRTVLTDVPLCFWLLAAVYCAWESFRAGSLRWAVAAGVAAGLAWWTKYNGWLAVVITAAGVVPWLVGGWAFRWRRAGRSRLSVEDAGQETRATPAGTLRTVGCWIVLAVVACAVWSPVFLALREHGGYGVVAANHRQYLVGFEGWWHSFRQQAANHQLLDSVLTWGTVAVACAVPVAWRAASRRGLTRTGCVGTVSVAGLALAFAAARSSSVVLAVLAAGGILDQLLPGRSRELPTGADRDRRLGAWLLAAWFVGLLVATPLYRAYPRLTLPWLVAAWLGAAATVQWLGTAHWWDRGISTRFRQIHALATASLLIVAGVPAAAARWDRVARTGVVGWSDRTAVRKTAGRIKEAAEAVLRRDYPGSDVPFVVYVYAEPAIVFHLTEAGVIAQPASNLDFVHTAAMRPDVPTFFVAGPHAKRSAEFAHQWRQERSRFELFGDARYAPSGLVLLNLRSALESNLDTHPDWRDSTIIPGRFWSFTGTGRPLTGRGPAWPDEESTARYWRATEPIRMYRVR